MQGDPPSRPGHGDLREPAPQAAPGLSSTACTAAQHHRTQRAPTLDATAVGRHPRRGGRGPAAESAGTGGAPGPRDELIREDHRKQARWHVSSASTSPATSGVEVALTYIYGVGRTRAQETLSATGVSPDLRVKDLGDDELVKLRDCLEGNYKLEGDLRREVAADIRRKVEIGCYQGLRHRRGLPVRGQRTHTNARTRKGPQAHRRRQEEGRPEVMPPARSAPAAKKVRRKEKKNVAHGHAHIKSTFNNTIVSITDPTGAVIAWASAGQVGFKGSRKSTPFAAQMAAEAAARRAMEHGMRKVDVFVKGPGSGRETAIRSLQATGLEVGVISDVTPVPHNGCRPPKRRRV